MRAGETRRYSCDTCGKNFNLTLEPDAPVAEEATPELCPFCAGNIEDFGEVK